MSKNYECRFPENELQGNQTMKTSWHSPWQGISKSIAPLLVLMLFLFGGQQLFSQIIIESGSKVANFGVDADVQANTTRFIYENGVLQPAGNGTNTDDWFQNE